MIGNVFITGVSSGIGWGLARQYLSQDWRVYGLSRREPADLAANPNFRFESVDLSNPERVEPGVKKLLTGLDRIHLVILNAGVLGRVADMSDITAEELRAVLETNLIANKGVLDAVFSMGIPVQQVVAISSGASTTAKRGWNAYAISKAALNMMVGLYATERPETHFCALAPGIVDTAMQDHISSVPADERFASLDMLRSAKGSPLMPKPDVAAVRLADGIAKATQYPTGAYLDIHSLVRRT